jgi:cyclophilin family peptidyl-prolyl cis-trans isomerase
MGYLPQAQPQKRGLQWWHWLLISAGGVIAICCILSAALVALSTIAASRTPPPTMFPSLTATAQSGQATCDLATHHCTGAPLMAIDQSATYIATITTSKGDIVIMLDASDAPIAVNNFVFLAQSHWYDGTYFWRVETPGKPSPLDPGGAPSQLSLIQGGSVASDGNDSSDVPGYTIRDDNPLPTDYSAGTISMANTGAENSASSQFFIDTADESQYFSRTYVTFGKVIQGMDVVKKIAPDDRIVTISITVQAE